MLCLHLMQLLLSKAFKEPLKQHLTDFYFHMQCSSCNCCTALQGGNIGTRETMVLGNKIPGDLRLHSKVSMTDN